MTTPPPASSDATSEHLLKEQHDAIDSLSKALGTAHSVGVLTTDNLSDVLHKLTNSKPFSITHPPEDGTLKPWTQFARWWADNYGHIYRHTRDGGARRGGGMRARYGDCSAPRIIPSPTTSTTTCRYSWTPLGGGLGQPWIWTMTGNGSGPAATTSRPSGLDSGTGCCAKHPLLNDTFWVLITVF